MITQAGLDVSVLSNTDERFFSYIDNPWTFRLFLEYIVEDGLKKAPELAQMDAALAAKERYLKSTRRSFYMPTVALFAGVKNYFSKTGEGTADRDMSSMAPAFSITQLQALGSLFPAKADDLEWNVGLNLSLPIFSGGEKIAENKKTGLELKKLRNDRRVLAEQLEQRIRSTIRLVGTSNAKIRPAKKAAAAAAKTLELVTDAYSRGAVSILELIDAQNASLVAGRGAANALYDFMVDLFTAQRATNQLDFLVRPEKQVRILSEFEAYLAKKGITLKKKRKKKK
ncbi:MAG: TolC family protein [bacterium]|nr:TolC family protein [bacterium]